MAVPIIGQNAMGAVMAVKNLPIWYWVIGKNRNANDAGLSPKFPNNCDYIMLITISKITILRI